MRTGPGTPNPFSTYQSAVGPYANGSWYGELSNTAYFRSVRVSNGGTGVVWPHGQDIAPRELYELSVPVEEPS